MKKTELNLRKILAAVDSMSTADYSNRDEMFLFRGRPVKGLEIYGTENFVVINYFDGTISKLTVFDNGSELGEVINSVINDELLLGVCRKMRENNAKHTYRPVYGASIYGYEVDYIEVTSEKFVAHLLNGATSERYLV